MGTRMLLRTMQIPLRCHLPLTFKGWVFALPPGPYHHISHRHHLLNEYRILIRSNLDPYILRPKEAVLQPTILSALPLTGN